MENGDNNEFAFLGTEDSISHFAKVDFSLRAGKHIQGHDSQFNEFYYVSKFYKELKNYYLLLFGVCLTKSSYGNEDYFYLLFEDNKGHFNSDLIDKLSTRHTLFGLLLLKITRLDRHFSQNTLAIDSLKDYLRDSSNMYREDMYRLFAKVQTKDMATDPDEQHIDQWIDSSLKKFEQLGWIFFEEELAFKVLPSFNRLFEIYKDTISNFEALTSTTYQ